MLASDWYCYDLQPVEKSRKMVLEGQYMTIRYANGYTQEAMLLSRSEDSMRVAIQGSEDVLQFNQVNGTWITDDCEPVQVDFAWSRTADLPVVTLNDCICSHELAAHLLHLLFTGENPPEGECAAVRTIVSAPLCYQIV
jgi:hypothetical protein